MSQQHGAPAGVEIVEVSPRDGLQNERTILGTAAKVHLLKQIAKAGVRRIEAVSFVRPDAVPAMADAEAVMAAITREQGVSYAGLVLNHRGLVRAKDSGVDEVNVVVPATETFNRRNQNATMEESIAVAEEIAAEAAASGIFCTVTVAVAFGCPFEGEVDPDAVLTVAARTALAGAAEIALADTIGVGVPSQVRHLFGEVRGSAPDVKIRGHFHNTRNTGYVNVLAAAELGVAALDTSIGGIGGCPFAPKATGNVATEDLVYMFDRMAYHTGLRLDVLIDTAEYLSRQLGYEVPALLPRAGTFP